MAVLAMFFALVAFVAGVVIGFAASARRTLRELGLTKESAQLYHRAARIFNRMVRVTELDGDFAADILSEPTHTQATEWLAEYRKQIDNV